MSELTESRHGSKSYWAQGVQVLTTYFFISLFGFTSLFYLLCPFFPRKLCTVSCHDLNILLTNYVIKLMTCDMGQPGPLSGTSNNLIMRVVSLRTLEDKVLKHLLDKRFFGEMLLYKGRWIRGNHRKKRCDNCVLVSCHQRTT